MADKNTYLTFSNGIKVPQIGLGTYKSKPGEVENAVKTAIDTGYRHLDCAFVYENEKEIGDALHELLTGGAIKREDLFVTTKIDEMASRNTYATFSNGIKVPLLGLGTWKSKPGEVKNAIKAAIDVGYRHFDGAHLYDNEKEVGEAYREKIADGTVKREDLFITTKLWSTFHRPERVEYGLRLSLKALQLDYVDLYLIHSPMGIQHKGDNVFFPTEENGEVPYDDICPTETWKAMEKLVEKGLAKSIGVSNFNIRQMEDILEIAKVPIATNQVENHPCLDQKEIADFCKSKNILITSYSPFGSPDRPWASDKDPNLLEDPVVKEIAADKGCTPGQVLIAYHLCQGFLCIPKSVTPSRIQQNFQSLDVKLSNDDINRLDTLACNYRAVAIHFWKSHVHYPF